MLSYVRTKLNTLSSHVPPPPRESPTKENGYRVTLSSSATSSCDSWKSSIARSRCVLPMYP